MNRCRFRCMSLLAFFLLFAQVLVSYAADMKPEEVVAKSLDAVGTAQARASAKSRVVESAVEYRILVGGAGYLDGKGVLVSQDDKMQFMMKLNNNLYRGEQFIYDGRDYQIARTTANQQRSSFGEFVQVQGAVLKDGLFGGVLSTAWPLYDLDHHKVKLSYAGIKKVDGNDAIELHYSSKKDGDMDISLFFDAQTFRHIETVYFVRVRAQLGNTNPLAASIDAPGTPSPSSPDSFGGPTGPVGGVSNEVATARQQESRYRLEEHFSDFKTADGLTLPTKYVIHYSQELGNGRTTVSEWTMTANNIMNGTGVDARNFQLK